MAQYDELFNTMTTEMKKAYPGHIYTGDEDYASVICLVVPAFSVRYLFQQEGIPLGRFIQIVGFRESFKSALACEMIRWHRLQQGNGVVVRTEPKPAPELWDSLLGYDRAALKIAKAKTIQEWNKVLTSWVTIISKKMDEDVDIGRSFPVCFVTDSLTAVLDDEQYAEIAKDGVPEAHYPSQARLLTDFLKYFMDKLDDYPFSWVGINHLKEKMERVGIFNKTVKTIPGGKGLAHAETVELEVTRKLPVNRKQGDEEEGVRIRIDVTKNSSAPHKSVQVEILWLMDHDNLDPITQAPRQKTWFDWHAASIEVLLEHYDSCPKEQKRKIDDVIELNGSMETRLFYSNTLGIRVSNKASFREAGLILENKLQNDPEFRKSLYPLYGIRRRNLFRPGVDFRRQVDDILLQIKAHS